MTGQQKLIYAGLFGFVIIVLVFACAYPLVSGNAQRTTSQQSETTDTQNNLTFAPDSKQSVGNSVIAVKTKNSNSLDVPAVQPQSEFPKSTLPVQKCVLSYPLAQSFQVVDLRIGKSIENSQLENQPDFLWYDQMKNIGDIAWTTMGSVDNSDVLLIASGHAAVLPEGIEKKAGQDLSPIVKQLELYTDAQLKQIAKEEPKAMQILKNLQLTVGALPTAKLKTNNFALVKTLEGNYAIVTQIDIKQVPFHNSKRILLWIYQPDGTAKFSKSALQALKRTTEKYRTLLAPESKPQEVYTGIASLRSLSEEDASVMDFRRRKLISPSIHRPTTPKEVNAEYFDKIALSCDLAYDGKSRQGLLISAGKIRHLGNGKLIDFIKDAEIKNSFNLLTLQQAAPRHLKKSRKDGDRLFGYRFRKNSIFTFKTRDERYVMVRVLDKSADEIKIRWVYQQDRTPRFPDISKLPPEKTVPQKNVQALNLALTKLAYAKINKQNKAEYKQKMKSLISQGADINCLIKKRGFPLSRAAIYGSPQTIQILVDLGASINLKGNAGGTALHSAAAAGNLENARKLLELGADVSLTDDQHLTALHTALRTNRKNENLIDLLQKHYEVSDSLLLAAETGNVDATKQAVKDGEKIDQQDEQGRTPLFIAVEKGHFEIVSILLNAKAKADVPGKIQYGRIAKQPIDVAIQKNHSEIVELLYEHLKPWKESRLQELLMQAVKMSQAQNTLFLIEQPLSIEKREEVFIQALLHGGNKVPNSHLR